MTDLVERLRERAEYEGYPGSTLTLQAADEIERLRANALANEDEHIRYVDYVGDALGQAESGESLWDAAQRVLSERDRLRDRLLTAREGLAHIKAVARLHAEGADTALEGRS